MIAVEKDFPWYQFFNWDENVELAPAPVSIAPPVKFSLSEVLECCWAQELLGGTIHIRNACVCRQWKAYADAGRRFFFLALHFTDGQKRLSYNRMKDIRVALTKYPGLDVLEVHGFYTMLGKDFNRQGREETRFCLWSGEVKHRLSEVYKLMHEIINKYHLVLKFLGYSFKSTSDYFSYISLLKNDGKIENGPFPMIKEVELNNEFCFTGVACNLLALMPNVERVKIVGALDMELDDELYWNEQSPEIASLTGVSASLPPCLVCLNLDSVHVSKYFRCIRFAGAFAHAAERGHFDMLVEVHMVNTFVNMKKAEGTLFMAALKHCKKLAKVVIGDKRKLKEWHFQAVHDLRDSRGRGFRVEWFDSQ